MLKHINDIRQKAAQAESLIHCPNCQYSWPYRGRFSLYACCPSCRRGVKIIDNKVKESQSAGISSHTQTERHVAHSTTPR